MLLNSGCVSCSNSCAQIVSRNDISEAVTNRGPNAINSTTTLENELWLVGSVLHIQGPEISKQPYTDADGNILLWNGEVFSGLRNFIAGVSDTVQISLLLQKVIKVAIEKHNIAHGSASTDVLSLSAAVLAAVTHCIGDVNGPYAFIYYNKTLQLLIYGRDPWGRRSLLKLKVKSSVFAISSVWAPMLPANSSDFDDSVIGFSDGGSDDGDVIDDDNRKDSNKDNNIDTTTGSNIALWVEVPVSGLFACIIGEKVTSQVSGTIEQATCECRKTTEIFAPWPTERIRLSRFPTNQKGSILPNPEKIMSPADITNINFERSSNLLLAALLSAVRCRVESIGFKSAVSCLASSSVTSTITGEISTPQLHSIDSTPVECALTTSLQGRNDNLQPCRVGVLFSGGIDSVVLAAILHLSLDDPLEPIDLFNVAFTGAEDIQVEDKDIDKDEMKSSKIIDGISISASIDGDADTKSHTQKAQKAETQSDKYSRKTEKNQKTKKESPAPDRLAAISALKELKLIYPTRDWRLVHVDVSSTERKLYENRVRSLIRPRNTHMDLNIGSALWFASRGKGYLREYTMEEMTAAGSTNDHSGRPLVRTGGTDAARSVGLSEWKQKENNTTCTTGQISSFMCGNAECRRVGKKGCLRNLCKRCCNKKENDDVTEIDGIHSTNIDQRNSVFICPVHKSSAKELEKMKIKKNQKIKFLGNNVSEINSGDDGILDPSLECNVEDSSRNADVHSIAADIDSFNNLNGSKDSVISDVCADLLSSIEISEIFVTGSTTVTATATPTVASSSSDSRAATISATSSPAPILIPYSTDCRALLIGIGADEQMVRIFLRTSLFRIPIIIIFYSNCFFCIFFF